MEGEKIVKAVSAFVNPSLYSSARYRFIKRLIDLIGSLFILVLTAPFLILIGVLIKLDSPGPVIFKQTRVGKSGRLFTCYKFRSMLINSDSEIHKRYVTQLMEEKNQPKNDSTAVYKLTNDKRVTRVGRWLRLTSLDELPQLINVLKGEMSLVGPRPALPYEVQLYEPWHFERLKVKPGLTGLWQVSGRSKLPFNTMLKLDTEYVKKWSIRLDALILAKTIPVVFRREGAV